MRPRCQPRAIDPFVDHASQDERRIRIGWRLGQDEVSWWSWSWDGLTFSSDSFVHSSEEAAALMAVATKHNRSRNRHGKAETHTSS